MAEILWQILHIFINYTNQYDDLIISFHASEARDCSLAWYDTSLGG